MHNRKLLYSTLVTYPFSLVWIYLGLELMAGGFIWFVFSLFLIPFAFIPFVQNVLLSGWNDIWINAFNVRGFFFLILTIWMLGIYISYSIVIWKSRVHFFERLAWWFGITLLSPIMAPLFLVRRRKIKPNTSLVLPIIP